MPPKLCECGCGQPTNVAKANDRRRGIAKGDYYRFVRGHQCRGRKPTPEQIAAQIAGQTGHAVSAETRRLISEHHKQAGIRPSAEAAAKGNASRGRRENSPAWRGGVSMMANGYRCLYSPDHPRAHHNGYVYEHILVAEQNLGRPLLPTEVAHHIDGDKLNNSPDNILVLASQSDHVRLHRAQGDVA